MDDEQIQRKVDETLGLLAASPRVKPEPFFYTRLKARMDGGAAPAARYQRLFHPGMVMAAAAVALLVAANAWSLVQLSSQSRAAREQAAAASFAQDYGISTTRY